MLRRTARKGLLLSAALLAVMPALTSAEGTIEVELTEAPPSVTTASTTAAGSTTFAVENVGGIPHELVVIRTDLAADALPVSGDSVELAQLDVIADSPTFGAGESGTLAADLPEGSYVLICNVPGHYGLGMRTALNVTGAASAGGPPAPVPAASGNAGLEAEESNLLASLGLGVLAAVLLGGVGALVRRRVSAS